MPETWFTTDTHFGHSSIIKLSDRPFGSVEEMDARIMDNWSKRVKPGDRVYHLGDVAWTAKSLALFKMLPGDKRVVLGNHDEARKIGEVCGGILTYPRFEDMGFICSHMPVAMPIKPDKLRINVHGHTHKYVLSTGYHLNICVEKTNYSPLHIEEVRALVGRMIDDMQEDI